MPVRVSWIEDLKCPQCGEVGSAKLSKADSQSWAVTVEGLPLGFKMIESGKYSNFFCIHCDRPAAL